MKIEQLKVERIPKLTNYSLKKDNNKKNSNSKKQNQDFNNILLEEVKKLQRK